MAPRQIIRRPIETRLGCATIDGVNAVREPHPQWGLKPKSMGSHAGHLNLCCRHSRRTIYKFFFTKVFVAPGTLGKVGSIEALLKVTNFRKRQKRVR